MAIYKYDDFVSEVKEVIGTSIKRQSPGSAIDVSFLDGDSKNYPNDNEVATRITSGIKYGGPISPPVLKIHKKRQAGYYIYSNGYFSQHGEAMPHTGTQWQIASNAGFSDVDILWSNILEHKDNLFGIHPYVYNAATHYIRARHVSNGFCSNWSNTVNFIETEYTLMADTTFSNAPPYLIAPKFYGYEFKFISGFLFNRISGNSTSPEHYTEIEVYSDDNSLVFSNKIRSNDSFHNKGEYSVWYNNDIPYTGEYTFYYRSMYEGIKTSWTMHHIFIDKKDVRSVCALPGDRSKQHSQLTMCGNDVGLITGGRYFDNISDAPDVWIRINLQASNDSPSLYTKEFTYIVPPVPGGGPMKITGHKCVSTVYSTTGIFGDMDFRTIASLIGGSDSVQGTYSPEAYDIDLTHASTLTIHKPGISALSLSLVHPQMYKIKQVTYNGGGSPTNKEFTYISGGEFDSVNKNAGNHILDFNGDTGITYPNTDVYYRYKGAAVQMPGTSPYYLGGIGYKKGYTGTTEEYISKTAYKYVFRDASMTEALGTKYIDVFRKISLPYPLAHQTSLFVNGEIYNFGGISVFAKVYDLGWKKEIFGYMSEVFKFDPENGDYQQVGHLQYSLADHSSARARDGRVFIYSGVSPHITADYNNLMVLG